MELIGLYLFLFGTFDRKSPTCYSLVHISPSFGALCLACLYSSPGPLDAYLSRALDPETYDFLCLPFTRSLSFVSFYF